jgi:hypothetical protein
MTSGVAGRGGPGVRTPPGSARAAHVIDPNPLSFFRIIAERTSAVGVTTVEKAAVLTNCQNHSRDVTLLAYCAT